MSPLIHSRVLGVLLCAGLTSACIIVADDGPEQDGTGAGDDLRPGDDGFTTGGFDDGDVGDDDGLPGDDGDDTGGPDLPGECSANLVADGGFEGGSPNDAWAEASALFGSPICDGNCSTDPAAMPRSGSYWAWFGGSEDEAESASLAQSVVIAGGDVAQLTFWLAIPSGAGQSNDVFWVSVDDTPVFSVSDADMDAYQGYQRVDVDISDFADGQSHTLLFGAEIHGAGLTSFFLDDVAIVSCTEPEPDDTTDDGGDTGDDTTGTTGDTGDATDTGDTDGTTDTGDTGTTGAT